VLKHACDALQAMASTPRGLINFIRDIRNCANKEDEKKRVNLELANVRTKFKSDKLTLYERKKCVRCGARVPHAGHCSGAPSSRRRRVARRGVRGAARRGAAPTRR
jgi:hypothetical protein